MQEKKTVLYIHHLYILIVLVTTGQVIQLILPILISRLQFNLVEF